MGRRETSQEGVDGTAEAIVSQEGLAHLVTVTPAEPAATDTPRPPGGGSYIRQADGTLVLAEHTRNPGVADPLARNEEA